MTRKDKLQLINDFLNGKPLINKYTVLTAINGEDWAEEMRTGRRYKIMTVKDYCTILYIDNREDFELLKNIG